MLFWLIAALLVLAVVAALLWPVGRRKWSRSGDEFRVSVYRHRLGEIDEEVKSGLVDAAQAAAAREEAEHNLLNDISGAAEEGGIDFQNEAGFGKGFAVLIAAFIAAAAVPVYLLLGSPESAVTGEGAIPLTADQHMQSIDAMIGALEQRLERDPDDINGWGLLNRSYLALGRYEDAVRAAERMYALAGDDAGVLLSYIHTLVTVNGGNFSGKPRELIERLLIIDPENTAGMWFAGLAAEQRGDDQEAVDFWNKVIPGLKDEPEALEKVRQRIAASQARIAGPSRSQTIPAGEKQAQQKKIKLKISLAPSLRNKVGPDDTLFIFAKAPGGPPAPLAVLRRRAGDLPLETVLDDSMAMMPAHKLSGYDKVNVVARVSKTGSIEARPGDLEGREDGVTVTAAKMTDIIISKELE